MSYIQSSVNFDDKEMKYIRFGKGKKTLVILPGLSIQSVIPLGALIEKQYEIFCEDFTVYLFDRRENVPEDYSVCNMADDTAKAMQSLGLSGVCLFGVSQGGMIAVLIALKYPELVGRLALASTACRITETNGAVLREWALLAEQGKVEELCLSFGEKVYPKAVFEENRESFAAMAKTVTQNDLKRFTILVRGTEGFDATKELYKINCPVIAIGDKTDNVLYASSTYEIAEHMKSNPEFELYMYDGFGHAVYDIAPDYTKRLINFFVIK